jgi:hypothetical protein
VYELGRVFLTIDGEEARRRSGPGNFYPDWEKFSRRRRRLYLMGKLFYTENMNVAVVFNPAAFKHGVNEADIRWAFDTAQ